MKPSSTSPNALKNLFSHRFLRLVSMWLLSLVLALGLILVQAESHGDRRACQSRQQDARPPPSGQLHLALPRADDNEGEALALFNRVTG